MYIYILFMINVISMAQTLNNSYTNTTRKPHNVTGTGTMNTITTGTDTITSTSPKDSPGALSSTTKVEVLSSSTSTTAISGTSYSSTSYSTTPYTYSSTSSSLESTSYTTQLITQDQDASKLIVKLGNICFDVKPQLYSYMAITGID